MAVNLSVVGGLPLGKIVPGGVRANDENECDWNEKPFGAEERRHYRPPKNDLIVFSAVPIARASAASARFNA